MRRGRRRDMLHAPTLYIARECPPTFRFVVPNQKRRRSSQRYVMFLMEAPETPENFPYKPLAGMQPGPHGK